MIFADKLIQLRKKAGLSQEDLAQKMNITRQSISKWEGGQSLPDLDKIIILSNLFNVSTDYLLKDDMDYIEDNVLPDETNKIRHVSMEDAKKFISVKLLTSKYIALGVFLCIISPICLMILSTMSEIPKYGLSSNISDTIGLLAILFFLIIAIPLFIISGKKTEEYEYLGKEVFITENNVKEMVKGEKRQYDNRHTLENIIGVICILLSFIPVFLTSLLGEGDDLIEIIMISIFLVIVGIGVIFLVRTNIIWESYEKLLQQHEYSKERKANISGLEALSSVYWLIATALYLGYSFATNNWGYSWIIWPIAAIIYPVIVIIIGQIKKIK